MIDIRIISAENQRDINIPNEPFPLFGRMLPSYVDGRWSYSVERSDTEGEMCFPDEHYSYEALAGHSTFLGAYDGEQCIGLAIIQEGFFRYMYLYDLKVNRAYRRCGVAKALVEKAREIAEEKGYLGIYTQGQDNNLGACLFYVKTGFYIGGFDCNVYKGTRQEGKGDIIFYLDC